MPAAPLDTEHSSLVIPRRSRRAGLALRSPGEGGFALLVTIVLVAFLVLILVGLAAFTRVETQVAANNQHQAQARQNALMALNIAVGQLQKYAGPDQRVTAKADLQNDPGQPNAHWTGVYGSAVAADYNATPGTIAVDLTTPANIVVDTANTSDSRANTGSPARLLNWLVSGNERTDFDPRRNDGDVGSLGNITSASPTVEFSPAAPVNGLAADTLATDTTLQIAGASGATPARLLVGGNSVASSVDASGRPIDYVVAPAVPITASPATVPGANPADGDVTIGRYAWWIGDEGVKARVNLPLAGTDPDLNAADRQKQIHDAFFNSTRAAVELMASDTPGWAVPPPALDAARIDTLYNPSQSVADIVTLGQTPFSSGSPGALSTALKHRFHDVSAVSTSVLSDTYAGGLKRDLSILLDPPSPLAASDPTADDNRMWVPQTSQSGITNADSGAFPSGTIAGFGIPTWKHLRSFYQTRVPVGGAQPPSMLPELPAHDKNGEPDHVGIAPVITYYSVGWRMAPAGARAAGTQINMNLYPLVVLWNPYDFTLRAPPTGSDGVSNYEVGIQPTYDVIVALEVEPAASPNTWEKRGLFNFKVHTSPTASNVDKHKFIRFRLACPDIPPGQSLVFSLPHTSSGDAYTQRNILRHLEPEESAYVSIPFRTVGSATTAATIQTGEENLNYRVRQSIRVTGTVTDPVTGEVQQTTYNDGFSFSPGGNGGMHIYLGEPDDIAHVLSADWQLDSRPGGARQLLNPSTSGPSPFPNRRWYNTHQNIGWDNNAATNPLQGPELLPLSPDTQSSIPSNVFLAQALFSGHGQNAQLNENQFMFTTRWIAQGNMRAVRSGRTRRDSNYNPLYIASAGSPNLQTPWQKFNLSSSAGDRTSAGQGHDAINNSPVDATLFEFPRENQEFFSIAQLQHANLSFFGTYPAYPIGNSLADYRMPASTRAGHFSSLPAGHQLVRTDTSAAGLAGDLARDMRGYYDISYLLNRTLWDRYYFSTVPATGTISPTDTFPNTRHIRRDTGIDLQNPDHSAAGLMLAGGFNINSTSEQAWRAILGAVNQLPYDPENPDSPGAALRSAFSRFSLPASDDDPDDAWSGYRTLSENQIAQLARNIVTEVRNRGPFVSLADFINRRLVDNTGTADNSEHYRGALQSAIDRTVADGGDFPANEPSGTFWSNDELAVGDGTSFHNQSSQYTNAYWDKGRLEGSMVATTPPTPPVKTAGNRSAFAPKYLTQADILSTIGSGLSARSDTFTIRTYGEVVNPATSDITARAWCEAVVQRLPDYVENSVNAWETPAGGSSDETFGRKFKIISFRWLSPSDI